VYRDAVGKVLDGTSRHQADLSIVYYESCRLLFQGSAKHYPAFLDCYETMIKDLKSFTILDAMAVLENEKWRPYFERVPPPLYGWTSALRAEKGSSPISLENLRRPK